MEKENTRHACEKQIGKHRSNEEKALPASSRMKEKTRSTAKQDLKTLVTILTVILKTMTKTDVQEFTMKELMIAIDSLKKKEISGQQGKRSRIYQMELTNKQKMIHQIFNLIIKQNSMAPKSWKSHDHSDLQETGGDKSRVVFRNSTNSSPHCITTDSTPSTISVPVSRRGRVHNGPLYDVQTHFPENQRMGDGHVGGSDRLQEGIRTFGS